MVVAVMKGKISIVIPVYCAEQSLSPLFERLINVLGGTGRKYELIFVDDCSTDNSWGVLQSLKEKHPEKLKIVRLLVNCGQHNAILCGFSMVTGDVVVTMDDDLQNPPEEIPRLVVGVDEGFDLVIGAYDSKKHSRIRNYGGGLIDKLQRRIFDLPPDFQLTSFRAAKRVVIDNVNHMSGAFPYITSMLLANASKYKNVSVPHDERQYGRSNYNLNRSLQLAINLILHYSTYPVYGIAILCLFAFLFSVSLGTWILFKALIFGISVPGWASTVVILTFFNGLILLSLLVFGLYISRFHQQMTRTRTTFKIDEIH